MTAAATTTSISARPSPKRGSDLTIDLSDSHAQVTSFVNSSYPNMYSAVVVALSYLIDPRHAEERRHVPPARGHRQAGHRGVGQPRRAGDPGDQPLRPGDHRGDHQGAGAGLPGPRDGRLGPPLPHRDPGQGPAQDQDKRPFIWHFFQARPGGGASPAGDGWPGAGEWQAAGGIKFGSLEVTEVRFPLFFRRHEFRPDSGGDGQYRGGPGGIVEMVVETAEPAVGNTAGDGVRHGACGILGGEDGAPHRYMLYSEGQRAARDQTKETGLVIRPGDGWCSNPAAAAAGAIPAERDRRTSATAATPKAGSSRPAPRHEA